MVCFVHIVKLIYESKPCMCNINRQRRYCRINDGVMMNGLEIPGMTTKHIEVAACRAIRRYDAYVDIQGLDMQLPGKRKRVTKRGSIWM